MCRKLICVLICRVCLKKKTLFRFPFHSQLVNYQRSKNSLLQFWLIKLISTATAWSLTRGLYLLPSLALGRGAPQRGRTGGRGLGDNLPEVPVQREDVQQDSHPSDWLPGWEWALPRGRPGATPAPGAEPTTQPPHIDLRLTLQFPCCL